LFSDASDRAFERSKSQVIRGPSLCRVAGRTHGNNAPVIREFGRNRCARRGRLRTTRLIAEHGANILVSEPLRILSADCPRRQAMERGQLADPCGIHCPGAGRAILTPSAPVPASACGILVASSPETSQQPALA
jgi:hypothetical protein